MNLSRLAACFWGERAKLRYLLLAAVVLLFTLLGQHDIWTQEYRWADIVSGMFYRHDFLHPYLGTTVYYDKPLLSYWLIAGLAQLTGLYNAAILRIPSALAGLLAVWSIYRLGLQLKDRRLGLLAGWLLLTTFYFIFWARTSSADMLNMAGSLCAVTWYMEKRNELSFFNYLIFFIILALTALCKGLVGMVVPAIAVLVDMALRCSWRMHVGWPFFFSLLPALAMYFLPFWASAHFGGQSYQENGLYLVYRENILRYFQPFDHKGPLYTYFIYLPVYLLPWTPLFLSMLFSVPKRFKSASLDSRWLMLTTTCLFLFFTLSGSRRNYYVLPIVPFAILMIADWLETYALTAWQQRLTAFVTITSFILFLMGIDVVPAWYYSEVGAKRFVSQLEQQASAKRPWAEWQIVMLDGTFKLNFYLHLKPNTPTYVILGRMRQAQTQTSLLKAWPFLSHPAPYTIYISRQAYLPLLRPYFSGYHLVQLKSSSLPFVDKKSLPIAFFPDA